MTFQSSLLDASAVRLVPGLSSKEELFRLLGSTSESAYGLDAAEVATRLGERERLGSTGFGRGVGIPHAKIGGLDQPVGLVVALAKPIEFGALDEQRVDLVFGLLSPLGGGSAHLKALAEISRLLRDEKMLAKLRGARDAGALFALLADRQERDAA